MCQLTFALTSLIRVLVVVDTVKGVGGGDLHRSQACEVRQGVSSRAESKEASVLLTRDVACKAGI